MSNRKDVITTCTRDCANSCGLVATVQDGRLIKLAGDPQHPFTKGRACVKAARYVHRVYSPERIVHPMIRRNGRWERASWDEALDLVAARMNAIRDASGPEAILYYQGYGERTALKLLNRYFFNLFGGVTTTCGSLCGGAGQGSQNLDFGERVSHDPLDHYNSNSMILWARNPASTNISLVPIIRDIRKRGGTVILVDPAYSKSVPLVDRHIKPKANTDGFLAMAAAKLILAAGKEDKEFLQRYSEGAQEYLDILDRFTVEELCSYCDVPVSDAQLLADTLIREYPTSMLMGWGLHRHEYAHYNLRAIDALGAISGNIGVSGGGVSQGFEEYGPYDQQYWGDQLNPPRRSLPLPTIGKAILEADNPPVRMIYVTASNPVCMAANSGAVAQAFSKAEFVVYSGHFMDDTSDYAHVFLPATTFLEEDDVMASYGHNYLGAVCKAIEPVGECRSDFETFYELAARFPFADRFRRSIKDWLHDLCAPVRAQGCDLEELKTTAFRCPAPMVAYADKTFSTPSGKYRFMTDFDPAPLLKKDKGYPYRLLTIAPHGYICSERTMAEHPPLPEIFLARSEADRLGMVAGDAVVVRSRVGSLVATLATQADQRPDVLVAERGGWLKAGHGLNLLTRDLASKVGNGTPYYETSVTVEPLDAHKYTMPRILVVQHSEEAPGGNFCKTLEQACAKLTTLQLFGEQKDSLPQSHDKWDGLVVLGGPQHSFDDVASPHFPQLMDLMRAFESANKPVAGICLGCQLLARAYGAELWTMPELEFGFVQHRVTDDGKKDAILGNLKELPRLMEFHEDTFHLPKDAALLIEGEKCVNQAFRVGKMSYGFQFHLEADSAIVSSWTKKFRQQEIPAYASYGKQYDDQYFAEMAAAQPLLVEYSGKFCKQVAENWLDLVRRQTKASAE